jgi:hypothetical protein
MTPRTPTTAAGTCVEWRGAVTSAGYGSVADGKGSSLLAHRVAYEQVFGPIPAGMTLDHLCRNRRCVNPDHLEPVTNRENILRGTSPSAVHARKTHCPKGHSYSAENTYTKPRGSRECRTCKRVARHERLLETGR